MQKHYFGAHMSIQNGVISAIDDIINLHGSMVQIFISNPMSTKTKINKKKFNEKDNELIRVKLNDTNTKLVIHLPYVINLAKNIPIDLSTCWWINMINDHLLVSESINSIGCIVHVGKYLNLTRAEGSENMFNALSHVINFMDSKHMNTHIILETSSGQGSELLATVDNSFDELATFYNKFNENQKKYIRICIDTCHIFTAGYDIRSIEQVKQFFEKFDSTIGLKYVDVVHLNDSKSTYASHLDRHENIGSGQIGITGLTHIIKYCLYSQIPMILETPSNYDGELNLINNIMTNEWQPIK